MSRVETDHQEDKPPRTSHDQIFKTVFSLFLDQLLEIVEPDLASILDLSSLKFLRGETFTDEPQGKRTEPDLLAEAGSRIGEREPVLIHLESEREYGSPMDRRVWRYYMHLEIKYGLPVVSIVVFLTGGTAGSHWREVVETLGPFEVNRFSYLAFGLSGSLAEDYVDRPQPLAAALAALMRSKVWDKVEQKLRCLRAISRSELNDAEKFLLGNVVETYLKLTPDDEKRYQEEIQRSLNKEVQRMVITWEDAHKASKAEGLEEGFIQGEATLLKRLLGRRFENLPTWIDDRLEQASRQELESWTDRVLDAKRLEDVFTPA